MGLEELRGCDQTGLLCWGQTGLGFGTRSGTAADTGQILSNTRERIFTAKWLSIIIQFYCRICDFENVWLSKVEGMAW